MKKFICTFLCIVMLLAMAVPVMAAEMQVYFTSGSGFEAGDTVTVDKQKTRKSIMDDPSCNSEEYNAALEGNIRFRWFRNDSAYKDGESITLTETDKGCEFMCRAYLFNDSACTDQCGVLDSARFTVPNTGNPALTPEITTTSFPDGTVGQDYYLHLDCTVSEAKFSLFRSSLPSGLDLSEDGIISGTPTKAGFWYVVIMTEYNGVEDTAEFEFTIKEAADTGYSMEIMQEPHKWEYTSGEKLDLTGLWVRIYTPDGYMDSYNGDKLGYTSKALVTVGDQKIKLTYKDAVAIFLVTVKPAPATESPTTPPTEATEAPTEVTEAVTEVTENLTEAPEVTESETQKATKPSGKDTKKEQVTEPVINTTGKDDQSIAGGIGILLVFLLILLFVLAAPAVVIILIVVKRKKAKNQEV